MKRLSNNIYQINALVSDIYVITTPAGLVLIDAGLPSAFRTIMRAVNQIGFHVGDISQILITHADPDHYGAIPALRRHSNLTVAVSAIEATAMAKGGMSRDLKPHGLEHITYSLLSPVMKSDSVQVDRQLLDGDIIPIMEGLSAIATPGHTPGHLSFFLPEQRILFCGDSMVFSAGSVKPSVGANTWDEAMARQSFEKQMDLHPSLILGGHGLIRLTS
jgi:glyoxylase-like metal-dependent hydrolase (beta-lactamase superfamily II)